MILQGGWGNGFYIHVYDGWLTSSTIVGPWTQATLGPFEAKRTNEIAQALGKAGKVDLLDGRPKADPKPSLANGVPTIYTAQGPAELITFKGQPDFVPIVGTPLLWASNTTNDVLIDTANNFYYVLAGRTMVHVRGADRPMDFCREQRSAPGIPSDSYRLTRGGRPAVGRGHAGGSGSGDR